MKRNSCKILLGLLVATLFMSGCLPSYTHSRGNVSIHTQPSSIQHLDKEPIDRFIIVSFWDYPAVNGKGGKVVINDVVLSEDGQITIDFPGKGYWVIWTPGLGTQHIAPEPGVMVFHKKHLPCWNVGGTGEHSRFCCEKPTSHHEFKLELVGSEKLLPQTENISLSEKILLRKFLAREKNLIRKMDQCKELAGEEKAMVLANLSSIAERIK